MLFLILLQTFYTALVSSEHGTPVGVLPFIVVALSIAVYYTMYMNNLSLYTNEELYEEIHGWMKFKIITPIASIVAVCYLACTVILFYVRPHTAYTEFMSTSGLSSTMTTVLYSLPRFTGNKMFVAFSFFCFVLGFHYLSSFAVRYIKYRLQVMELAERGYEVIEYGSYYVPARLAPVGKR